MFGNFLMTSLMEDSNVLSERNAGLELASPQAYGNKYYMKIVFS